MAGRQSAAMVLGLPALSRNDHGLCPGRGTKLDSLS